MLTLSEAKKIVHGRQLNPRDQLLVVLAIEPRSPLQVRDIRERCRKCGLSKVGRMNISDILGRSNGLATRTDEGWELQESGLVSIRKMAQSAKLNLVVTNSSQSLRNHAAAVSDPLTKSFVMEAICCFEAEQYRAAVVFSWAGAVALLQKHVFDTKLVLFNAEASKRNADWRAARQQDDLGRMKEHDFLDVCEAIAVIGKPVKRILQQECLVLRNGCGHPSTLKLAEISVAAHIEKLIHNVFARFW